MSQHRKPLFAFVLAATIGGCVVSDSKDSAPSADSPSAAQQAPASPPATTMPADSATAQAPVSDMRVEVDLNARQLHLYKGQERVGTHSVAVGSQRWPTQTGDWKITQVVFNPEWVPPDESWAEQREPRDPGDPKNPLGRIQLVYDPPRSIHGTYERASIGKAISHGSIRVTNEVGLRIAKQLMESAGVPKDSAWYQSAQRNRTEKQVVDLPGGVPIRVF